MLFASASGTKLDVSVCTYIYIEREKIDCLIYLVGYIGLSMDLSISLSVCILRTFISTFLLLLRRSPSLYIYLQGHSNSQYDWALAIGSER
jgi:hypothetical protein